MTVINVFKKLKFGDWAIKLELMTRDQVDFAMSKKIFQTKCCDTCALKRVSSIMNSWPK